MEYEALVRTSHGVSQNTYHMIWCTKYRYAVFRTKIFQEVCELFVRKVAKRHGIEVFEIRVLPDHVHVFARLPRTMCVAEAFRRLKGGSAYEIRRFATLLYKYKALWSKFTFSRTVGSVTGKVIENYISETNTKGRYGTQLKLSI